MDHQQSNLISLNSQRSHPDEPSPTTQPNPDIKTQTTQSEPQSQNLNNKQQKQGPVDILVELTQKNNPLPLLAVIDQVDLFKRTKEGVPIFNLLMNKFLPVADLLQNGKIKFQTDLDGRTPLHYAVQVDDAKAVQWLLSKGAHNVADKFGNTPVMDAVWLGHRRSFLLCLHYQHINQELAHVAAEYNRVWELRCMLALGLKINIKNSKGKTPLEIAVENYSYQAAQYLATVTQNYDITNLSSLTDSSALIRRVKRGYQKSSYTHRALYPLLYKSAEILLIFATVNYSPLFNNITSITNNTNKLILLYLILQLLTCLLSIFQKPTRHTPQSIPRLLHQPYFPNNLDHICPSCFQRYHPEKQDHCDICHVCVPKFHQHHYVCVNKSNQFVWFLGEFVFGWVLWGVVGVVVGDYRVGYHGVISGDSTDTPSFIYSLILSIYNIAIPQNNPILAITILTISFLLLKQILFCLQLFGMAFMNRTYQQVTHSEDYPHLYQVFKSNSGKLKTKELRIFLKFKLCGGLIIGLRNIVLYFW